MERGDVGSGLAGLEAAMAEDPSFVEPVLALASYRASEGNREEALRLTEEAVARGLAMVDRIPPRAGGGPPAWWHDQATRPYMKALVARGFRLLERGDPALAAVAFAEVFELEPAQDPLEAGIFAAEAFLRAGDPMAALDLYSRLLEQPAVAYGRSLALFATGQREPGLVSLWLALLINPRVAVELSGPLPWSGFDLELLVGDRREAEELLDRTADLWPGEPLRAMAALIEDRGLRQDLVRFAALARDLDLAEDAALEAKLLGEIEVLLDADRIGRQARDLLRRTDAASAAEPKRLPQL